MPEVNKILAAICFSEYCSHTFLYATRLAEQLNADLVVANIINIKDVRGISAIQSMGYSVSAEDYVRGVTEERQEQMEQMIADSGFPRERLNVIFNVGVPYDELQRIIEAEHIDLIVVGAKGKGDHPHLLVGSVAEKMFRHSPVSVVIYRKKGI
jgi:nucleotide-binding universal stress UspA family protein